MKNEMSSFVGVAKQLKVRVLFATCALHKLVCLFHFITRFIVFLLMHLSGIQAHGYLFSEITKRFVHNPWHMDISLLKGKRMLKIESKLEC